VAPAAIEFWDISSAIELATGQRWQVRRVGPVGIGTMDAAERAFTGALYRIDQDASATRILDDIGVSNGLDWSPDGTTLYYTDSKRRLIWRFPFDMKSAPDRGDSLRLLMCQPDSPRSDVESVELGPPKQSDGNAPLEATRHRSHGAVRSYRVIPRRPMRPAPHKTSVHRR